MSWSANNRWLDDSATDRVQPGILLRFHALLAVTRLPGALVALVGMLGAAASWLVAGAVRGIEAGHAAGDMRAMTWGLAALVGIAAVQAAALFGVRRGSAALATRGNQRIVTTFYEHLLGARVDAFLEFQRRTNLFQRVIDALAVTREFAESGLQAVVAAVMLPIYLGAMLTVSPAAAAALAVTWVVLALGAARFGTALRRRRARTLATGYPLVERMLEIIGGLLTIKALSGGPRMTSDIRELVEAKRAAESDELFTEAAAQLVTQLVTAVGTSACVAAALLVPSTDESGIGGLVAVWLIAGFAVPAGGVAAAQWQALQTLSSNVESFFETLALPQETVARHDRPPALAPGPDRSVAFDGVSFCYAADRPVLRDVSVRIAAGEHVCLVGASGAGKTTLLRLLLGFMPPSAGTIRAGGMALEPATDMTRYRQQFGVVGQRDFFFGTSLRENLAFGLAQPPSEDAMRAVLDDVGLLGRVDALADRLEARYVPNLFSGGEEQRLFVARALLRDPAIVLLDEPTSALDFESERLVLAALERLSHARTTITIAHRLSTVRQADRVLVLAEGRIAADGTHDALLETSPYYRDLCTFNSFLLS